MSSKEIRHMAWNPSTILSFVRGLPTSAHTALVETDVGLGYLKALGGKEGPQTLASEVVATELAKWFKLPTLEWHEIIVDEIDEIPFLNSLGEESGEFAAPGPAFITREEKGGPWNGTKAQLELLENPQDISRLVVFDTWVMNCDRYSEKEHNGVIRKRRNTDNVFLSEETSPGKFLLKAMDHTHCFTCGHGWTRKLSNIDSIRDNKLFGLFPEFQPFLDRTVIAEAADDLRRIDSDTISEIAQRIPNEWGVKQDALDALRRLVIQRATYVADTIETRIWPQRDLFADNED